MNLRKLICKGRLSRIGAIYGRHIWLDRNLISVALCNWVGQYFPHQITQSSMWPIPLINWCFFAWRHPQIVALLVDKNKKSDDRVQLNKGIEIVSEWRLDNLTRLFNN